MALSNEDSLRLNVLLAQDLKAVRIDESKLIVYALSSKGDAKVQLNPTSKHEKYVREVKELLSQKTMGSPGGYPVYIKRWTRMGQERREQSLAQLLLLGEPEAVIAVVHAPQLSPEIASYAWWALPSSENARKLLEKPEIASSALARELAEFLLEFLPFEEEHKDMIESVRLCLQPGLLKPEEIDDLWKRARRKQSMYVGFLHSMADQLPEQKSPHPMYEQFSAHMSTNELQQNLYARQLLRYLSPQGQAFIDTAKRVLEKAATQDTVVSLFESFSRYNQHLPHAHLKQRCIHAAQQQAYLWMQQGDETHLQQLVNSSSEFHSQIRSMLIIAQMGEVSLFDIFGLTDALGTVMRKKLKPMTDPLLTHFNQLCA